MANADCLSRLPLSRAPETVPVPWENIHVMNVLRSTPVTSEEVKNWTKKDPVLSRIIKFVQYGWPEECPEEALKPYFVRRSELSVQDDCILWGNRVIIPEPGREAIMCGLHETHPGICRMKALARSFVWWPKMDADLEAKVRGCTQCQVYQKSPAAAPLHPWEFPRRPWQRIHIDYAGPYLGKMFLIVVDAHSKWIEAFPMNTSTTTATITKLRGLFATHGLPEIIVSDNGTNFTSWEFKEFVDRNGIRHIRTAPYHPSSNGLAERAVQTFKESLKKLVKSSPDSIEDQVSKLLFKYRITPHTTTGISPAELLLGRKPMSRLDLVHPDVSSRVRKKQEMQKLIHDQHARNRNFVAGDEIYARNFRPGDKWVSGKVVQKTGPVSYKVEFEDGCSRRRHQDHVRKKTDRETTSQISDSVEFEVTDVQQTVESTVQDKVRSPARSS